MAKYTEEQIRNKLKEAGYILHKSRAQRITSNNMGDYLVVDTETTAAILGPNFDATLDDVESWAQEMGILEG